MIILGITDPISEDNAAAILVDGELVAMVEEERLNRIKHAPHMVPQKSIQWCLEMAGCALEDVDVIAIGWDHPKTIFRDNLKSVAKRFATGQILGARSVRSQYRGFRYHKQLLSHLGALGIRPDPRLDGRVMFVRHHMAHAASAFFLSPFQEANIVSLDGSGGQDSGLIAIGRGTEIRVVHQVPVETSWGQFYERFTERLGFRAHNDEGKVMGLAAYGDHEGEIFPFVHLSSPRGHSLFDRQRYLKTGYPYLDRDGLRAALASIKPRAKGASPINGYHEHVAARLQFSLEQVVGRITEVLHERSSLTDFCLAGGTSLNCSSNGKLLQLPHVQGLFVQPAASDSGTALGAAVYAHVQRTGQRPTTVFNHAYWGPEFTNDEIEATMKQAKVTYRKVDDIAVETAKLIAENKIIGWFQGRMEVGPRALGARSVLANPMDERMKDAVNKNVKFREWWRPFAPSILAEHMKEYFGTECPSPFMILAFEACNEVKLRIPATLHVDGTGRPQTVDRDTNPRYWHLINEFKKLTGVPVLLNTSFNVDSEPIVCTPSNALATFYMCGLDALAIGDFLVEKRPQEG